MFWSNASLKILLKIYLSLYIDIYYVCNIYSVCNIYTIYNKYNIYNITYIFNICIYIIYKYTQIGNRLPRHTECSNNSQKQDGCNIHAVKETMCPSAYHSNDFVATHALEKINLPQVAFLGRKAALSFVRLFFCGEERNPQIFIHQFSVHFLDAHKSLAENPYAHEGEFLKVIDHARFKYSINTWEGMTQGREFL